MMTMAGSALAAALLCAAQATPVRDVSRANRMSVRRTLPALSRAPAAAPARAPAAAPARTPAPAAAAARPPRLPAPSRLLEAQVRLDRSGFSPGPIDGRDGKTTRSALGAFQAEHGLPGSGLPTARTLAALRAAAPGDVLAVVTLAAGDVGDSFLDAIPDEVMEKAKLPSLGYTSPLEELAERRHSSPELLRRLNPRARFQAGETLVLPVVDAAAAAKATAGATGGEPSPAGGAGGEQSPAKKDAGAGGEQSPAKKDAGAGGEQSPAKKDAGAGGEQSPAKKDAVAGGEQSPAGKAARVIVSARRFDLRVEAADGRVLLYAPVTAGSDRDPLPAGTWRVTSISRMPRFHYNPDLFWDAEPGSSRTTLAPGPNNPVGTVWIDIDRPHYGLHGTDEPARVGRSQSHGCVRLTNWDAERLAALVRVGTPVVFEPGETRAAAARPPEASLSAARRRR